jgi:hypothetical protein
MINPGSNICLTDELERQLMKQAIEEQYRFKPVVAFKNLFAAIAARFARADRSVESHNADVGVAQNA